jgi:hypothetical protein
MKDAFRAAIRFAAALPLARGRAAPALAVDQTFETEEATVRVETCAPGCQSESEAKLGVAPGVTGLFIWERFSLSLDGRYQMVFADETLRALIFSVGFGF